MLGGLTISGGTAVISGSVASGQTVNFAVPGGDLALANSSTFAAIISGFGAGDTIDLGGFVYSAGTETSSFAEAANNTSGTLTVVDGGIQAQLTLAGSYVTSNFTLATDSAGGTLVTVSPEGRAAPLPAGAPRSPAGDERWPGSSRQRFAAVKWSLCRLVS